MNKRYIIPLTAVVGGTVGLILRWLQNARSFEPDTGLPVAGHPAGIALAVWLAVLAVLLIFLTRRLPRESVYPETFSTTESSLMILPVMGMLLFGLSGALDVAALTAPELVPDGRGLTPVMQLLFAATALIPTAVLFQAASVCRRTDEAEEVGEDGDGEEAAEEADTAHVYLLVIPVCLVVRLVLTYRLCSVNPSLEEYYVPLLALVLMILAFYRLSGCAFRAGDTRRFALYAAAAVALCIAALADRAALSQVLFLTGGAMTLLGYLLLRLSCKESAAG